MIAARWLSGLLGLACLLASIIRLRVDGVTVCALIFIAVWLLLVGAHRRSFWVGDDPDPQPSRLDELDRR